VTSTDTKPEVVFSRRGRHLEKWIWRHNSAVGASIWTKFVSLMQNNVQISGKWSKSKPKVDFLYGGRLFFNNGSSYISAINWNMSTKFGLFIDFDLLKAAISTNAKPEILLLRFGRHIALSRWRPRSLNTISGFAWRNVQGAKRPVKGRKVQWAKPLCLAAISQPQQHLNGQHSTLGKQEQLQLFCSIQHSSRQSYAMCRVLIWCWVIAAKLLSKWQTFAV